MASYSDLGPSAKGLDNNYLKGLGVVSWPFLERLQTGQAVHVAALGASITFGHGAAKPFQKNSWAYQAFTSINASFPNAGHRFTNAARPATSPSFAALCVDALVPPGVHLVMIEYSPNGSGHRFLADLVVGAVLELYMMHQLPLPPVGDTSGRELEARLSELRRQEPVIAGNFARYSSCGIGEELSTRIIASDGFELAFGGKLRDKPGMLSEKPGSTLELNLSTETEDPQSFARFEPGNVPAPGSAKIPERRSLVMLGFLAGPSMGRARVECTRGCKCAPQEFHFQLAGDNSVVKLFDLPISTLGSRNHVHPLVGGESRKKHRVKLMAVMVSDATSRSDLGQLCDGCAIPLDDANPDGYISDMDEWPRLS
eukprot:gene345-632_t